MPMTPKNTQGNRNALKVPVMEDGLRGWSYGIFDCFSDPRECMCGLRSTTLSSLPYPNSLVISGLSSCCCCYTYSRNKRRLEYLETHGTPLREPVGTCNRDCQLYGLFALAAPALQVRLSFPSPWTLGLRLSGFHRPSADMMCVGGTGSVEMLSKTSLSVFVATLVDSFKSIARSYWKSRASTNCIYICFVISCVTNSTRRMVMISGLVVCPLARNVTRGIRREARKATYFGTFTDIIHTTSTVYCATSSFRCANGLVKEWACLHR
jgi:hypothetical protein